MFKQLLTNTVNEPASEKGRVLNCGDVCFENLAHMEKDVFFLTSVLFQNRSCMYCTKLGTNVVQGENVHLWRENQVMSHCVVIFFLVPLLILAVRSQSDLSVLQGRRIYFPFTD